VLAFHKQGKKTKRKISLVFFLMKLVQMTISQNRLIMISLWRDSERLREEISKTKAIPLSI